MFKKSLPFLLVIFLANCAGLNQMTTSQIKVENNVLISDKMPKIKVAINDTKLKFCFAKKDNNFRDFVDSTAGSTIEKQDFLFADIENKYVAKRMLRISFRKASKGSWLPDIYEKVKPKISHGVIKAGEANHQYCTFVGSNILQDLRKELDKEGYLLKSTYLVYSIGRIYGAKSNGLYYIDYMESVSDMNASWSNSQVYSQAQAERLNKFLATAKSVYSID